jgi:hypothetical protein
MSLPLPSHPRPFGVVLMNRVRLIPVAFLAWVVCGTTCSGQEAPHLAELRFVRDLRARHYGDLALEYLERLRKKNPSPELLRELPLELAKTRLDAAEDEPDSAKRLIIYGLARAEIEAFLKNDPNHPRAGEAKLDIGHVVVLQGKTQLSRALAQDALEAKIAEGLKARQTFADASVLLNKAASEIDAELAKVSQPKNDAEQARQTKLATDRLQAQLAIAMNFIDQAQTYLDEAKTEVMVERGKKVQEATKRLEKLASEDANNPISWQATAWLGWCMNLNGNPQKARAKLFEVINSAVPAVVDGRRLARYFRLYIQYTQPLEEEKKDPRFLASLITDANGWLVSYPSYSRTPEGCGLRYLLAQLLRQRAGDPKTPPLQKDGDLARARRLLAEVEHTENDYTDLARRLKIAIIKDQKGFVLPVASLPTFEDCYVRAQYEMIATGDDAKPDKDGVKPDDSKLEQTRKARATTIIAALRRGLTLPDAKAVSGKVPPEVNNARAMLAFYCLNQRQFPEAIEAGERFARDDPRSSQAAMAGVYALQAYGQLIGQHEREGVSAEKLSADRAKMLALAHYLEERWPGELAGDVARHQIALTLFREQKQAKEPAEQARFLNDAVAKLAAVGKDYPSYILVQYQLADACLQAERDNLDPPPGQKAGAYRQHALAVLTALPDPGPNSDATVNQMFVQGKIKLAWELYKDKQLEPMLRLAEGLSKRLATLPLEEEARQRMLANVTDVRLFAIAGLAEADFAKARYAEVATRLDPLAAAVNGTDTAAENKLVAGQLKKNLQLGSVLLSMDLRANVQLSRLDRVETIMKALQSLTADGDEAGGSAKVLQTLVFLIKQQIDELDRKGDQENKEKAIAGFTKILDKVAEQPDKLDMQQRLLLAQCFANMDRHQKAADLLDKVATPAEKGAQLLYARELRLAKNVEKAREVVNDMLGTAKAPGWGARNIEVLLEDVSLMEDEGKYDKAALKANDIVRKLLPNVTRDNALKEKYFEAYYHVVYSFVKYGENLTDAGQKDKALRRAAVQALELDKKWPNYGGDTSAKRFNELLSKDAAFKEIVDRLKANDK